MNDTVNGFDIHGVFHGVEQAQPVGAALEAERVAFEAEYAVAGEGVSDVYDAMWHAFQKGAAWQARAQLAAPSSEYLTEAVKTLDNLSRRADARQQRIDQLAAPAGVSVGAGNNDPE